MREMARAGLPVVVVSHQLDRIAELCTQAILLSHGAVAHMGNPPDVISAYMRGAASTSSSATDSPVVISSIEAIEGIQARSGECVHVRVTGTVRVQPARHIEALALIVRSAQTGEIVYATGSSVQDVAFAPGDFTVDLGFRMNVQPGIYMIDAGVWDRASEKQLYAGPTLTLRVLEGRTAIRLHLLAQSLLTGTMTSRRGYCRRASARPTAKHSISATPGSCTG